MTMLRSFILTTALALVLASPAGADTNAPADPSVEATAPQGSPSQTGALTAEAWFDRANATYALGEAVKLFVRTNEDAYVTALSIGPTGNVTQIFPNPFHPNNLVQAHHPIAIPGHGAHAVVTGALGAEVIKIITTSRPIQVIPEDQLGATAPFRSVVGGVDAVARDFKTVAAQPEQDMVVLDKTFLSVPPAPAPTYFNSAQAPAPTYSYPAHAHFYPAPAPQEAEYGYPAPEYGYAAPEFGYAVPEYGYPAPEYAYPPARRTATPWRRTATPRRHTAIPSRQSGLDRRLRSPRAPAFHRRPNSTTRIRSQLPAMWIWSRSARRREGREAERSHRPVDGGQNGPENFEDRKRERAMFIMSIRVSFLVASFIAAATPAAAATAANDSCAPLVAAFDHAVAAKSIDGAIDAVAAIEADIVCGARTDEFRHKLTNSMIGIAGDPQVSDAERKKALAEAQQTIDHAGTWRDAEHLADYYWGRKDNLNAFTWYERGLAFISARPAEHASANDIKQLETRASAAKSLASDDNGGKKPAQFASSRGDMDGRVGGIYSPDLLRGAEVEVVPLPINFVTGEATFTPVGEKAAAELAEAVKQQNVHVVTLVGHTDPRGEHQYNVALSIRRAEALRAYLQSHGISAQINVDGKGPDEPFDASLLGRSISQDEEYALDRRVEWVRHSTSE